MICIRRRRGLSAASSSSVMSWPSKAIRPSVGSWRRRMVRPKVVLPQPLSPMSPTVSPRRMEASTPLTAFTRWRDGEESRRASPLRRSKCLLSPRTSTNGSPASGRALTAFPRRGCTAPLARARPRASRRGTGRRPPPPGSGAGTGTRAAARWAREPCPRWARFVSSARPSVEWNVAVRACRGVGGPR